MEENSFKALLEEDKKHFEQHHEKNIRDSVQANLTAFKLIGEVVEIYLSRVKDIAVIAFTDNNKK